MSMFDLFFKLSVSIPQLEKILRLRKPGRVFLVVKSQEENGMLKFVLDLPVSSTADVVTRELKVQIAGAEPVVFSLPKEAVESEALIGADNDAVVGSLVDIDDAGNRSEASEFSFVLIDTIAPAKPGEVNLRVVEEV